MVVGQKAHDESYEEDFYGKKKKFIGNTNIISI